MSGARVIEDDLPALSALWESNVKQRSASGVAWQRQVRALSRLGIPMETALQVLHQQQPSWEAFQAWLQERSRPMTATSSAAPNASVLSQEQRQFWDENGYLVLRGAASRAQCEAACQAIWEFLGADANQPASWYRDHPGKRGIMLDFYDHPALDANRELALVRSVCEQLYGTQAIYPAIDKVGFNPPEGHAWHFLGSPLHWDASLCLPMPFQLQGLLYLGDCDAHEGAFHCVPGFHKRLPQWLADVPQGVHPRQWALQDLRPVAVPGQAGDVVLWHQALPHCATPNHGSRPRMVQYLTYLPDTIEVQAAWI